MQLPTADATVRPDVRHYLDYRAYLRDMYAHLKVVDAEFSYRVFSRRAGLSSPNYLKLVAEGQRNLSPDSAPKFARGLQLERREGRVFRLLVEYDAALDDRARADILARISVAAQGHPAAERRRDVVALDASWVPRAVLELAELPDFEPRPDLIAKRLRPSVRVGDAKRALELLRRLELLPDPAGACPNADTPRQRDIEVPEVSDLRQRARVRSHVTRAAGSLEVLNERLAAAEVATLTLSPAGVVRAQEAMAALRTKLEAIADDDAERRPSGAAVYALTCVMDRASS